MSTGQICKTARMLLGSAILAMCIISTAAAAPGTLTDKPLFVGSQSVKPNIMFLVDDSGSMGRVTLENSGVNANRNGDVNTISYEDPSPDDAKANSKKRLLCAGYNVMAYNPKIKYTPWPGNDDSGNPLPNMALSAARDDPYLSKGSTTDLTKHVYYQWNDLNNDGMYQGPGDSDPNATYTTKDECDITGKGKVAVKNLPKVGTDNAPNSQQNYANWYSYYRSRILVTKAAMSEIVYDSSYRIGFKTLNNNNNTNTPVTDMSIPENKTAILENIFKIQHGHGTPLRSGLKSIGQYFAGNDSPILGSEAGGQCQRNFAVVMSDGYWNGDVDKNNNDTLGVGNVDKNAPHPYGDDYSNTLADVAYLYYDTDLKPNIDNKVPPLPGIDEKTTQHMTTYTVAFGVMGTLSCDPVTDSKCQWPQPKADEQTTIDDMYHAAVNGHGKFLSATDPQALINSFKNALTDISAMSGTLAPATFNTTSLLSDSLVYQAEFDTSGWRGDLTARRITEEGILTNIEWSAAEELNNIADVSNRNIYTFDGTDKVDFSWANLTTAQQADLLVNSDGSSNYGDRIVAYLKGDHTNEGTAPGQFRPRNNQRLGDIVHSGPTFVGKPFAGYPDDIEGGIVDNVDKRYSTFATATAQVYRKGLVYVGANDGALHAFNSLTGEEEFAYIPSMLFSSESGKGLHALAEPGYDHNYYVDLSTTAADVYINDAWRTVLVGGLRGGGKGIFALDVTDEDLNDKDDVLFEFTHDDLGYTYSEIQVAKMNNGNWSAIFGNGYNNTGDGTAKLFIVDLETGIAKVLETKVGTIANASCSDVDSVCNGLSTPALADLDGDYIIDRIYAGDVLGNMWVFDVSNTDPNLWGSAYKDTDPTPLFTACSTTPDYTKSILEACPSSNKQPITSKPSLAWHPTQHSSASAPNILVFFGTGQFLTANDLNTTDQQNFYGVWDRGVSNLNPDNLQLRTIKEATYISVNPSVSEVVRVMDQEKPVDYFTQYGWNIQLPTLKERVVVNPTVFGDLVFFTTLIPGDSQNAQGNPCDSMDGGSGWLMAVKLATGGEPDFASVDLNQDFVVNNDDALADQFAVGTKARGAATESRFIGNKRVTPGESRTVKIFGNPPPPRSAWSVE